MALLTSVSQASVNALAAWLTTKLGSDVTVEPRWPDQKDLFAATTKVVSIIPVGRRIDEKTDVIPLTTTIVDATHVDSQWVISTCRQLLQLDCWTQSDLERDDLERRVEEACAVGLESIGGTNEDPFAGSLLLSLSSGDGWGSTKADFTFDSPERIDDSNSAQVSEYRSLIRGEVAFNFTVTARSARLATIILSERLAQGDASTTDRGTATTTASGTIFDL